MAKRVGLVLSGRGTELREAVLALLAIERNGGRPVFMAPDPALEEASRLARGPVRDLASVAIDHLDALVFPGGPGVGTVLSNYAERGVTCDVHPELVRLLKDALARRRPLGFACLAPILAARVLGPVAGVRVTLGPRGTAADKHAAVMGADVRPCPVREIIVDEKSRVVSTPAYMYDDARLPEVAVGIEKMVRTVLQLARGARPVTPDRGSGGSARGPSGTRPPRSPSPPRGS